MSERTETALELLRIGAEGNGTSLTGVECVAVLALLGHPTQKVVRVCGVDCHPGDEHCNNYCRDGRVKSPPLFAPRVSPTED